jgi:CDP-diacylglycerol--serine O-phosphatidyltransferase
MNEDHDLKTRLRSVRDTARGEGAEHPRLRRGIYLLPNLITTAAMFAGFYAIVAGFNGRFGAAVIAIYAAGFLDVADGRVARATRTQSPFGAEYDSLSDMVAFGVAPGLVAFSWALSGLGKIGFVVTFVYMACGALRLARFNTAGSETHFTGLASPATAGTIASLIWVLNESRLPGDPVGMWSAGILAVAVLAAGLLMVSNITYWSPKLISLRGRVPFVTLVMAVFVFAVVLADPPRVFLVLGVVYALSGPVMFLWNWARGNKEEAEDVEATKE